MRVSLPVSLLAAVFALACESSAPPPPPMGLAGAPGGAQGGTGAGANPGLPGAVATTQNPHAQPQNPHAGQPVAPPNPHGAMPGDPAGGPKASPFPGSAPVVVRADKPAGEPAPLAKGVVSGTVQETMNAAGYTYLRLKNASGGDVWVAVTEAKVEIGKNVSVVESLTMTDFHSKALNRTFPSIVFGSLN